MVSLLDYENQNSLMKFMMQIYCSVARSDANILKCLVIGPTTVGVPGIKDKKFFSSNQGPLCSRSRLEPAMIRECLRNSNMFLMNVLQDTDLKFVFL